MKKELFEYLNGQRNAVKDEFIVSRQKTKGAVEKVFLTHPDIKEPLYALWHNTKKSKKGKYRVAEKQPDEHEFKIERVKPKHIGGKSPYVMLMEGKTRKADPLPFKAAGLLFNLVYCGNIEWHTGRVIRKRDEKTMTVKMLSKQFKVGISKMKDMVSELTATGIMTYDKNKKAYFVSRDIVKKGVSSSENQI